MLVGAQTIEDLDAFFGNKLNFNVHVTNISKVGYESVGFIFRNSFYFSNIALYIQLIEAV